MSDPFGRVKGGRLTFKGGILASRSKTIDKKKKKKTKKDDEGGEGAAQPSPPQAAEEAENAVAGDAAEIYTIDAAKRMKYDELFPVEAKKFGYDPKSKDYKSVEDALDDRVKKKADRYCK